MAKNKNNDIKTFTQITGLCRVWTNEYGKGKKKFTMFNTSVGRKIDKKNYINASLPVWFSDDAKEKFTDSDIDFLDDYHEINITDGWLTVRDRSEKDEYNDIALFVNDFEFVE